MLRVIISHRGLQRSRCVLTDLNRVLSVSKLICWSNSNWEGKQCGGGIQKSQNNPQHMSKCNSMFHVSPIRTSQHSKISYNNNIHYRCIFMLCLHNCSHTLRHTSQTDCKHHCSIQTEYRHSIIKVLHHTVESWRKMRKKSWEDMRKQPGFQTIQTWKHNRRVKASSTTSHMAH